MTAATATPARPAAPAAGARRLRLVRRARRDVLAALGGLATCAAFPPVNAWPLALAGPALLLAAVRGSRSAAAFRYGTWYGLAMFVPLLSWLGNLGPLPWLALSAVEALLWGALTAAAPVLLRRRPWPLWAAAWWVAAEAVRSRAPLGGFPWARLAFSQADSPALGWASVLGAPGLSALVALGAACLAALCTARPGRRTAAAFALAAALATGALGSVLLPAPARKGDSSATVAVVQGNVPRERTLAEQSRLRQVTDNHIRATGDLAAAVRAGRTPAPDLVLWPENSTDTDPRADPALFTAIDNAVKDVGAPVLVGAVLDGPDGRIYNTGLMWRPDSGPGQWYAKQHLVPFGEYIPLREVFGGLKDLQLIPRDFIPGTGATVFRTGPVALADSICYEVGYDSQVRDAVRSGANLLAVQSNNATYMRDGSRGEPGQQIAIARIRAVEHNRSVVVAATTGTSAVITPDGRITARTALWTSDTLVEQVPLRTATTPADRLGPWPEAAASLLAVTAIASAATRRILTRKR
ncbi:apolipoprotein N-acyltransferase [Kitasatospora cineracea]|uniref:Apolipoprotein N-acyltransferase n=1 Tax=Kitasatospora cineracea TaxID=88074 RepID=A0A8G1XAB8_9ACTN|nr:apolipoprotein N-acyltransferase [Kitasatospora cineracea]ROR43010.1 apolipoprotein N-acyltransferase [Kitasatospora cineracea]